VRVIAEEWNIGICLEEKTQTLAWQVGSPPWQCPYSWYAKGLQVPGQGIHYKIGSSTLFIWLSPLWILALSKIKKKCPKETKILLMFLTSNTTWCYCDISPKTIFKTVLAMALLSHEVLSFTRKYFEGAACA
jgi:hypothetical protein